MKESDRNVGNGGNLEEFEIQGPMIQMQWNTNAKVTPVIAGNNLQNIWIVLCG
jgi:hypothetical protein